MKYILGYSTLIWIFLSGVFALKEISDMLPNNKFSAIPLSILMVYGALVFLYVEDKLGFNPWD